MGIGVLHVKVILDQQRNIRYGSDSVVTGNLVLQYKGEQAELFGPLRADIHFHGRAKTKIMKKNGPSGTGTGNRVTYRGRAPLFSMRLNIHKGPIKLQPNESWPIPFALTFPECTAGSGNWATDHRFHTSPGAPLPPSFDISYRGFVHRFDAFVEYRVGAVVQMPDIAVKVQGISEVDEPSVFYEQPRPSLDQISRRPLAIEQSVRVSNAELLPEADRPSGFKERTKAIFKSDYYPVFMFDVKVIAPQIIYLKDPISFEVQVRPNGDNSNDLVVPDITIEASNISITAFTYARSEPALFGTQESDGEDTVASYPKVTAIPAGPFSKAHDWTKTASTAPLWGMQSSFKTYNIFRTYTMKLRVDLKCAGKNTTIEREFPVTILPPMKNDTHSSGEASSSTAPRSTLDNALPAYEEPPNYGQVADNAPPAEGKKEETTTSNDFR